MKGYATYVWKDMPASTRASVYVYARLYVYMNGSRNVRARA
jgi:hypothetical protein